ncbi:type II membrane protein [Collariella sp. IMI 366227]|nr:type II membrane protein [Collariella sp. IMI 366227]
MKPPSPRWSWSTRTALTSLLLLTPTTPTAAAALDSTALTCDNLLVDNQKYDLRALAGPHTVVTSEHTPPTYHNTTYTLDLCAPLVRKGEVPRGERCDQVIPIVGPAAHGEDTKTPFTWEAARVPAQDQTQKDAKREGVRITLLGAGRTSSARRGRSSKDESTPEQQLIKDGAALVWNGYKHEKDKNGEVDTLYLTWYTKHACDAAVGAPDQESQHWGFFTWFVILAFLLIATYLIFGSWLNYNRHGARGWDLLPHGDMLRDVPYLMKDLIRRVLNTVQSSGSRGGYSAV